MKAHGKSSPSLPVRRDAPIRLSEPGPRPCPLGMCPRLWSGVVGWREAGCPIERRASRPIFQTSCHSDPTATAHGIIRLTGRRPNSPGLNARHQRRSSVRAPPSSRRHRQPLHRVAQPPQPPLHDRAHNHAPSLPTRLHRVRQRTPTRLVPTKPPRRLDHHTLELRIPRPPPPAPAGAEESPPSPAPLFSPSSSGPLPIRHLAISPPTISTFLRTDWQPKIPTHNFSQKNLPLPPTPAPPTIYNQTRAHQSPSKTRASPRICAQKRRALHKGERAKKRQANRTTPGSGVCKRRGQRSAQCPLNRSKRLTTARACTGAATPEARSPQKRAHIGLASPFQISLFGGTGLRPVSSHPPTPNPHAQPPHAPQTQPSSTSNPIHPHPPPRLQSSPRRSPSPRPL